jgi:NAD(P)H-hydrate epimerase
MRQCDIWVDALLGTGLKSDMRGLFKEATEFLNSLQKPTLAVDIPSGLDSDTGKVRGACVRAMITATFGLPKIGQVVFPGADFVGRLEVVDIGIPSVIVDEVNPKHYLMDSHTTKAILKPRSPVMHKGNAGHLLVLGGSPGKTGAAVMTSYAAMRVGAGLVTLGIPKSLNAAMESQLTEVMTAPLPENSSGALVYSAYEKIVKLLAQKNGLAIGPGLGTAKSTQQLVRKLVESSPVPVVIDADGLNSIVGHLECLKKAKTHVVMTPHPGEMARLVGTTPAAVQADRVSVARDFATTHGVHLVLKGAKTITAHPEGTVLINPTGNPGMASGGMGDALTGIIGGLIVQGVSVHDAVNSGVYLHGSAADFLADSLGPVGFLTSDLIEVLPEQMKTLVKTVSEDECNNSFVRSI